MIDRRATLAGLAGLSAAAAARTPEGTPPTPPDPREELALWPGAPPGLPDVPPREVVEDRSADPRQPDRAMYGITRPRLVVFRPARPNGAGLLVAPGGGYARVVLDKEGFEIGRWLSARGWTVFVLFYRLPGEGWADRADVPLADGQRAMRLIRSRAAAYGVNPARLGMMGFSAGGHLCSDLATRFAAPAYRPVDAADRLSARPAFFAPIYGVQAMTPDIAHKGSRDLLLGANPSDALTAAHSPAHNVTAATPPCFLVHAEDDPTVSPENSLQLRAACKRAGVLVECHLFAEGGHGFGLRRAAGKPASAWPELFAAWSARQGIGG